MQVQTFNNNSFQARQNSDLSGYNARRNPRHNIDAVIALDDNQVKQIAYDVTLKTSEDKKHKKLSNLMFASIPMVAGLSTAILAPAKSRVITKEMTGVAARLLNGAKVATSWGALLGLGAGVIAVRDKLEEKIPALNKFNNQNPIIAFLGTTAAFIGSIALGGKYIPKSVEYAGKHIKLDSILKFENKTLKIAENFNNKSFVKNVEKQASGLKNMKALEPLKGVVKTALEWAPSVLLWGGVLHSYNHKNVKDREFVRNYSDIKDFQANLAKARIKELALQNAVLTGKV